MKNSWQKTKELFRQFFTLDDTANNIAGGVSLGIFLGILPGEGVATALIIASLLKLNRTSATIGVLATNMWSTVAALPLAAFLGGYLFNESSRQLIAQFNQTYHLGFKYFLSKAIFFDLALPLLVGFLLVATALSLFSYFIFYALLKYKRKI